MPLPVNILTFFQLMALIFIGLIVPNIYNIYASEVYEICYNVRDADGDRLIDELTCIGIKVDGIVSMSNISNMSVDVEICLDGVDNNRNGEIDEPACTEPSTQFEYCNNNADDDLDGKIDEPDDCILIELCNNNIDDDHDGKIDEQPCIVMAEIYVTSLLA